MANGLMKAGAIAPVMMIIPMIVGLLVGQHNSLSQHMSELQLLGGWIPWSVRISAGLAGVAIILFAGACCLLRGGFRFSWTGIAAFLFGVGMVSNGVFVMGSPLHGLYGLPIFSILVPAFFVAEFHDRISWKGFIGLSLAASTLSLVYMWILLIGLDPAAYRGLTQRLGTLIIFGWFSIAAFEQTRVRS
ncbi:MAG: DUF998 domain-containing protein [Pseudomonadota bacterium]